MSGLYFDDVDAQRSRCPDPTSTRLGANSLLESGASSLLELSAFSLLELGVTSALELAAKIGK